MFIDYKADVERPLPMIYQSGYLTIKDFDMDSGEYLLDFPNNEVRKGFLTMVANGYFNSGSMGVDSWISSGVRLLKNEQVQAKARVDCIIEYPEYVYIFEFKLDGSADDAMRQIESKNYAKPYMQDPRTVIKIGVNFSSETRTLQEWRQKS